MTVEAAGAASWARRSTSSIRSRLPGRQVEQHLVHPVQEVRHVRQVGDPVELPQGLRQPPEPGQGLGLVQVMVKRVALRTGPRQPAQDLLPASLPDGRRQPMACPEQAHRHEAEGERQRQQQANDRHEVE